MKKWSRINYLPCLPLGRDGRRVTGSRKHIVQSRNAAREGMVLLKNENNVLPLSLGQKVVLMGKGTADYVKGGGGSGDVVVDYSMTLADGMREKMAKGKVQVFDELIDFYVDNIWAQYNSGCVPGLTSEPEIPADLLERAREFSDTAIVSISRFSGEGWDRTSVGEADIRREYGSWEGEDRDVNLANQIFERGDFYLSKAEEKMIETAKKNFAHVIVVMNVGGMVDSEWFYQDDRIEAVLMAWQGGIEGGGAAADIICGDANPSGHLTDTFAKSLEDYPSSAEFHKSADYVEYTDDIYVGYRYFETIPGAAERVNYPFGFGLSYTNFEIVLDNAMVKDQQIIFEVLVRNAGNVAGKEVVQIYASAPQGKLGKAKKVLVGFTKTFFLDPGERQLIKVSVDIKNLASYDDQGLVQKSAWVLEKGKYRFYVGENVRDAGETEFIYEVTEDRVLEQLSERLKPYGLTKRMLADGTFQEVQVEEKPQDPCGFERQDPLSLEGVLPIVRGESGKSLLRMQMEKKPQLIDVYKGKMSLDDFLIQLPLQNRIDLLGGQPNTGLANTFGIGNQAEYGIPNVMTADGPAGLRVTADSGVTTTAWPCATMLACSWNTELVEGVGRSAALEVKENNIGMWLTPACCIHRSPLCGRNFEYYSEDPFLSGKIGAAMVNGIQSEHIAASPKHFAANNKETNRKASDSIVSERALREIYLKQFEIIVKESDPWTIMSSYNLLNGTHTSESYDLLTGILREEWGFQGMVTTDWWSLGEHYLETKAGNDLKMANGYPDRVKKAYEMGLISEEEINLAVKNILGLILKID